MINIAAQITAAPGAEVTGVCRTRSAGPVRLLGAAHVVGYSAGPAGTLVLNAGGSPGRVIGACHVAT